MMVNIIQQEQPRRTWHPSREHLPKAFTDVDAFIGTLRANLNNASFFMTSDTVKSSYVMWICMHLVCDRQKKYEKKELLIAYVAYK